MKTLEATYDPTDNKLRLRSATRLEKELYLRVKSHGFIWAPKQDLFVAPAWTPEREDFLLSMCDEICDEDTSLVERSAERAERFEDYSDKRASDAESAHKAVGAIAGGIPLGQPILAGHHSERRARKDAERIENGMRRAVKMWETSKYWEDRARGAIRSAKYKERPDVRARRIKKLEAERRAQVRIAEDAELALRFWRGQMCLKNRETGEKRPLEITEANRALIAKECGNREVIGRFYVVRDTERSFGGWSPWDVLQPDGERYNACPSCTIEQCREAAEQAFTRQLLRVSRWLAHYDNRLTYERAMLAEDGGTATDRTGPEKGGAVKCWASVRGCWSYIQKVNKVSVTVLDNWGNGGGNFTRTIAFDKCFSIMTAAQVQEARDAGRLVETSCKTGFGLCEDDTAKKAVETSEERGDREHKEATAKEESKPFEAMKETLKQGVKVVSAPQLFPTPPALAQRMVELAEIPVSDPSLRILEPSAGTGAILEQIFVYGGTITAVEINLTLAHELARRYAAVDVRRCDFLTCNGDLGKFDRILMNPPFEHGSDIKHILHARTFLNPGGLLVAICANGPRQRETLCPIAEQWIDLPDDTFKDQGTSVRTALVVLSKEEA